MAPAESSSRRLVLFTKPARPGRVKTRLIGELSAEEAAELHAAFVGDLLERLAGGAFGLEIAWDLEPGEAVPEGPVPGTRQQGGDLGERLFAALSAAGRRHPHVAALGSDHPHLPRERVEEAFERLEAGAEVVLGPAEDGGYYLVAVAAGALVPRLFAGVPWSSPGVLATTLERCRELGLATELLAEDWDVDRPEDLARLGAALARREIACPRTRALLASWSRLP